MQSECIQSAACQSSGRFGPAPLRAIRDPFAVRLVLGLAGRVRDWRSAVLLWSRAPKAFRPIPPGLPAAYSQSVQHVSVFVAWIPPPGSHARHGLIQAEPRPTDKHELDLEMLKDLFVCGCEEVPIV